MAPSDINNSVIKSVDIFKICVKGDKNMGNWKEAERIREAILKAEGVIIDGKHYSPILGKGYIHDRYSCSCGFTDNSGWKELYHELRNPSHKMTKNW